MSADNYYMVRKTEAGKFVAVMGFASDRDEPTVEPGREYFEFDSPIDALYWAQEQGAEYGASLHPECGNWKLSKSDQS